MLSVPLNHDIERRLSEAEKAIEDGGPRLTSEQVRKELGLEH